MKLVSPNSNSVHSGLTRDARNLFFRRLGSGLQSLFFEEAVRKTFVFTKFIVFFLSFSLLSSRPGWAWGKRGHEIVAATAAKLLESQAPYLRSHEFDLGYYANVPDIVWRDDEVGKKMEAPQHYIDWNKTFERIFGQPKFIPVEFSNFKKQMGDEFKLSLGVVPFRIHGLIKLCKSLAENLDEQKQGPLLVCLGEVAHYTGDLSMPLHTTDNHDGQMSGQKGVHEYFETFLVDQLDPDLKVEVIKHAFEGRQRSELFKIGDPDVAVRWLIKNSHNQIEKLLSIDKSLDRENVPIEKLNFKPMIIDRLVQGAYLTALVWKEILRPVKHFENNHFYFFDPKPKYVVPGKEL